MATVTYEQLCTPLSRTDVLAIILPVLAGPTPGEGFSVDSWTPTSFPRLFIESDAEVNVSLSERVVAIAKLATLDRSSGAWLTFKASEDYGLDRLPASATVGTRTLVESLGTPHTFAAGELSITSSLDADLVFTNRDIVVLPASGSVSATFTSAGVGTQYNVDGATVGELATPIPGVTISPTTGLGWITASGSDEEEDEPLRVRCRAARVVRAENEAGGSSGPEDLYRFAALAFDEVNRVYVQEHDLAVPPSPAVTVLLAGPAGPVSPASVAMIDLVIQKRRPLGTLVEVLSATPYALDLYGQITVKVALRATAEAAIASALTKWVNGGTITVNGEDLPGLQIGSPVYMSQIIEIIMSVAGVTNVVLKDSGGTPLIPGTDDIYPPGDRVAALTNYLTYTEV